MIEVIEHEGHTIAVGRYQRKDVVPLDVIRDWPKTDGYILLLSAGDENKITHGVYQPGGEEAAYVFRTQGKSLKWNGLPPQWVLSLIHKLTGLPAIGETPTG
jgi:hypothetical protein